MASLQGFHQDVETRENVHEYLVEYLKGKLLDTAFGGEDVKPIAEAKAIIDGAFENMDNMFSSKKESKLPLNEAR